MTEGSRLLVEEYFASGDARFLDELRRVDPKKLGAFPERWVKDSRSWAREQASTYLRDALNLASQRPLVKRLFKLAEAAADDRLMAEFMVAFDRSVRKKKRTRFDGAARQPVERLRAANGAGGGFKVHTRNYLRRRAWRYFRRIGFRDPKRFLAGVMQALPLYTDADCDDGIHFLDNWGLMHVLFHESDVIWARAHGWFVRGGRALRELQPAPAFPHAWKDADAEIFTLLLSARARPVRRAAHAMLKARPDLLQKVPVERVLRLLEHPDEEMQALGVELLGSAAGLESVPLEAWTRLLESRNLAVLEAVCAMMARILAPGRFSTAQVLAFATAPVGPVAKLGLDWLKARPASPEELLGLAHVRADAVASDAVAWARQKLAALPEFNPDWVLAFLDSSTLSVRAAAWAWFSDEKRARHRLDLWAKLVESPYDDIRIAIVKHLERFAEIDTALRVLLARAPLETVWATVLLNIHRGNRAKRLAASQVAEAIERDPARADQLLPLLAAAARSIRAPEFRAGLAAVVRTATRRPEVAAAVGRHFPELKLAP